MPILPRQKSALQGDRATRALHRAERPYQSPGIEEEVSARLLRDAAKRRATARVSDWFEDLIAEGVFSLAGRLVCWGRTARRGDVTSCDTMCYARTRDARSAQFTLRRKGLDPPDDARCFDRNIAAKPCLATDRQEICKPKPIRHPS